MQNKCYVVPTKSVCSANCVFCITKKRKYNDYKEFIEIDSKFEDNLHLLMKKNIKRFEITGGGEPFLNNNLQQIIDKIRNSSPDVFIKLYTNGNMQKKINGIDELNISVTHWDSDINNSFMNFNNRTNVMSNIEFFGLDRTYKLRLSVPLLRGGIDSPEKAKELIDRTKEWVDSYVMRPLFENTHGREKYFVDFEFHHPDVELDRNCSFDDDVILWWTDNEIYAKWDLSKKM